MRRCWTRPDTVSGAFRRVQAALISGWKAIEKSFERQFESSVAAAKARAAKEKEQAAEKASEKSNASSPEKSLFAKVASLRTQLKPDTDFEAETEDTEDDFEAECDELQGAESAAPVKPVVTSLKRRPVKLQTKVNRVIENWKLPDLSVLEDPPATRVRVDKREIEEKAQIIIDKLGKFDVGGDVVAAKSGPAVTLFEFRPNADVQLTSITNRADDLPLALSAESLRIIAPVPGRDVVGIETSNANRETVYFKDILADSKFWKDRITLRNR